MLKTIKVVTRLQDNGDGGWTMYVYNNHEEMLADHFLAQHGQVTDEQSHEILTEHDPYRNGYLGTDTIQVEVAEDGSLKLAKPLSLSAGQ